MVYMPHWPTPLGKRDISLGLDRVHELLARLGSPQTKLPPVIHISGTNGKGSTTAYLKAIFESAGLKVHRYCSPHLIHFNERIHLAGNDITDQYLYAIMEEVRLAADGLQTTFFEATTAGAFLAFAKVPADVVLLEVGMGGRLDATNVVDSPLVSIITPISFDHMEFLGNSIGAIAYEKAGIIKPSVPVVSSWQLREALEVIEKVSIERGAELHACGGGWSFEVNENGFVLHDIEIGEAYHLPQPSLMGLHQIVNAAAVAASCTKYLCKHFPITLQDIQGGITEAKWPGRMQHITAGVLVNTLPEGFELWVDGAHNIGGAEMIAATVAHKWGDKPVYLINGRTGERDIKGFLMYFKNIVEAVYAVKVESEPKGESADNIAHAARELGFEAHSCQNIKNAVERIVRDAKGPARILATGSLYLTGDVLLANEV